jgi:hypothetical protein
VRVLEEGGVEEAADGEERYGDLPHSNIVFLSQGSEKSRDDGLAGALVVRKHECSLIEEVVQYIALEELARATEVPYGGAVVKAKGIALIEHCLYSLVAGIAEDEVVDQLSQLSHKLKNVGFRTWVMADGSVTDVEK